MTCCWIFTESCLGLPYLGRGGGGVEPSDEQKRNNYVIYEDLVNTFFFISDYIFSAFFFFLLWFSFFFLLLLFFPILNEGNPLIPNLNYFEFPAHQWISKCGPRLSGVLHSLIWYLWGQIFLIYFNQDNVSNGFHPCRMATS